MYNSNKDNSKKINLIKYLFSDQIAQPLFKKKINLDKDPKYDFFSYGNNNPNKIFYVIRRSPGAGLFSNLIYVINHLQIAENHDFIPIIDMENYPTIYNENKIIDHTKNSWLYYFEPVSKYSLNEVYKSKNVILSKNEFYDSFTYKIFQNKSLLKLSKKIIIKKYIKQKVKEFFKENSINKYKTLGIHYKGTSYKNSANYPFPPTYNQLVKEINKLLNKNKFKKIFFATEDKKMLNLIIKKYKNKIILFDSFRSFKDGTFKNHNRFNHRFKLGEEILIESLILAECHTFLFVQTNLSTFIQFFKKKNQILIPLNNRFNSSNEYIARWLWHIKKILPRKLGGFD